MAQSESVKHTKWPVALGLAAGGFEVEGDVAHLGQYGLSEEHVGVA